MSASCFFLLEQLQCPPMIVLVLVAAHWCVDDLLAFFSRPKPMVAASSEYDDKGSGARKRNPSTRCA